MIASFPSLIQKYSPKTYTFFTKHPFFAALFIHLIIITIYCCVNLIQGGGHAVFIDITEGVNLSDASNRVYYSYADNWGEAIAEKQRIVPFTIMWQLYKFLPLGEDDYVPFRILFGYFLSIIGFVSALRLVYDSDSHKKDSNSPKLFWAILFGTAIYIYNPWMTNRIIHNFLYFSTFTVPLSFGLAYKYFFGSPKKQLLWLMLNGLLLGTFMTTPHTILLVGIVLFAVILMALIRREYKKILIFMLTVVPLAIASGLYWLLTFLLYKPSPDRVESLSILQLLAQHATPFKVLKLQGYWWDLILPDYSPLKDQISKIISNIIYLIPLGFLTLAVWINPKKRFSQIFSVIFIIAFFLSTYTILSAPIYEFLIFNEKTKFIGWMFREVEKFSYLIGLAYALGLFSLILSMGKKSLMKLVCLFSILVLVLYGVYLNAYVHKNLVKVPIPQDFHEMNRIFGLDKSEYNVVFYPSVQRTNWSTHLDSANYISNLSSDKPALPNVEGDSYTRYFIESVLDPRTLDSVNVGRALNTIGAKYLIIRKDSIGFDSKSLMQELDGQHSVTKIWEGDYLAIYDNAEYKGLLEVRNYKLSTNLGLNVWPTLDFAEINSRNYFIEYLDSPFETDNNNPEVPMAYLLDSEGPMDIAMNSFISEFNYPSDDVKVTDPDSNWAIGSLTNKTHAEVGLYFQNYNITNRQLNYDHEVVLTLGGFKWPESIDSGLQPLNLVFIPKSGYKVEVKDGKTLIDHKGEEFDDVWSIFTSSKFKVGNISSIGFKGEIKADEYLEPHFKFYYYSESDQLLGIQAFYPKNDSIESVFKVPTGTDSVSFSVWSRGKGYGQTQFKIEDLAFYNLENDYVYPKINSKVHTSCKGECSVIARVLRSNNYPSLLEFTVKGEKYELNNTSLESKYVWLKIADIYNDLQEVDIEIKNIEGFNSVAAIAIVDTQEFQEKLDGIRAYFDQNTTRYPVYEDGTSVYLDNSYDMAYSSGRNALDHYVRYSPIKYSFEVTRLPEPAYLAFKKPYKSAWRLTCPEGVKMPAINSFSNLWVVKEKGLCVAEYWPQSLYLRGLGLSIGAIMMALIVMAFQILPRNTHESRLTKDG